jgi:hypothetical protein
MKIDQTGDAAVSSAPIFDEKRVFACKKTDLSEAVS